MNFAITDIVIIVIILFTTLMGIKKGFVKMLIGLIASIIAFGLTLWLTPMAVKFTMDNFDIDESLQGVISKPMQESIPDISKTVFLYDLDGDPLTALEIAYDTGSGVVGLDTMFKKNPIYSLMVAVLETSLVNEMNEIEGSVTALNLVSRYFVKLIFLIAGYLLLWIIIKIVLTLLLNLLHKLVTSMYLAHFVNKLTGGVLGLAIAAIVVVLLVTVCQFLIGYESMSVLKTDIDKSVLGKLIMENNILYDKLLTIIDLDAILAKINQLFVK